MARSKKEQNQHDRIVKKMAKEYEEKGYEVQADVEGWKQPGTIGGLRPEKKKKKKGHQTVVEIETPGSLDGKRDQEQQKAFKKWSNRASGKHFRKIVTKE